MRLYHYFRSSASYRVRIALAYKGVSAERVAVDLARGAQRDPDYLAVNPQGLVPSLVDGDFTLGQSLAILEYLEETVPEPPLLPADAPGRARVRSLAAVIACDVHPLQNQGTARYLMKRLGHDEEETTAWRRHWIERGLGAFERLLASHPETGRFCHGDRPTLADVCLVPQLVNADRYACDLSACPTVQRVRETCEALDAFAATAPASFAGAG